MFVRISIISWLLPFIALGGSSFTFDEIQKHNLDTLASTIKRGYTSFCNSNIDHGAFSFYEGGDPRDTNIEFISCAGNRTRLFLKDLHQLGRHFDYTKNTLIYINGFVSTTTDLPDIIRNISNCSRSFNIVILNFAHNVQMLYNTCLYNTPIFAYAVLRLIDTLLYNRLSKHNIVLVGHSQGAQIAALASKLFEQQNAWKLPILIALDPAIPCHPDNQYVCRDLAEQVLVIHSNNGDFGLKEPVGTVDYYPNGIDKFQPGCNSQACSHEIAVRIFAESVCSPSSFMAIRCKDWNAFQRNMCYRGGVVPISLRIPLGVSGKFYSVTKKKAPYGMGLMGIRAENMEKW